MSAAAQKLPGWGVVRDKMLTKPGPGSEFAAVAGQVLGSVASSEGESVVVGVRVRPFNDREKTMDGNEVCIRMEGPTTILTHKGKEFPFTFDESFWSHDGFEEDEDGVLVPTEGSNYADQQYVYQKFGERVLNNAWEGFHCCLFAYGQTGSGKSYSMVGYGANKGIVPISCEEIFRRIDASENDNIRYELVVSIVEIYNETVQDLLILPRDRPPGGLEIRESKLLGVYIDNVQKTPVESYEDVEKAVEEATSNRTVASTQMNATSSRAHTVVTIEFKQVEVIDENETEKVSTINLVDLAGSEKAGQTGAKGARLKEGAMINKSLSALGNVIEKLAEKSTKSKKKDILVPYRDSKLTRLLQQALGGSSKTIMICALSPSSVNAEETLSTLRYADRAKRIKNMAVINENPQDKLIRQMKEENDKLKQMMDMITGGSQGAVDVDVVQIMQKQDELAKAKEALAHMQKSFEEKKRLDSERREDMRSRRSVARNSGPHKLNPYIANLNEDMQLNGKLRFYFKEGETTTIGRYTEDSDSDSSSRSGSDRDSDEHSSQGSSSDEEELPPDVVLNMEGILRRHAAVKNTDGRCVLSAFGTAARSTYVNGKSVAQLLKRREDDDKDSEGSKTFGSNTWGMRSSTVELEDDGVVLSHGDRVTFSKSIFVFVVDTDGLGDVTIASGQVSYEMALLELSGNRTRRRQTMIALGGERAASQHDDLDSDLDDGCEREDVRCPFCQRARIIEDSDLRTELEEKNREIAQLLAQVTEAREALAAAEAARTANQVPQVALDADAFLQPDGTGLEWPAGLVPTMRATFEDAVGALDQLQMKLTSSPGKSRLLTKYA